MELSKKKGHEGGLDRGGFNQESGSKTESFPSEGHAMVYSLAKRLRDKAAPADAARPAAAGPARAAAPTIDLKPVDRLTHEEGETPNHKAFGDAAPAVEIRPLRRAEGVQASTVRSRPDAEDGCKAKPPQDSAAFSRTGSERQSEAGAASLRENTKVSSSAVKAVDAILSGPAAAREFGVRPDERPVPVSPARGEGNASASPAEAKKPETAKGTASGTTSTDKPLNEGKPAQAAVSGASAPTRQPQPAADIARAKQAGAPASEPSQPPARPEAAATPAAAEKNTTGATPEAAAAAGQAAAAKFQPGQAAAAKTGSEPQKPEQAKAQAGKVEALSPDAQKKSGSVGDKQADAAGQKAEGTQQKTEGAAEAKARADTATRPSDMATGTAARMEARNSAPAKTSGGGGDGGSGGAGGGGGGNGGGNQSPPKMQKRFYDDNFRNVLTDGLANVRKNLITIGVFSFFVNLIVLCVPIYLFQISDRVLTSRSTDTLVMLTIIVVGALAIHVLLDMVRRMILMRVAVDTETRLGPSVLSAAAKASQNGSNREYQVLHDLQSLRNFITGPVLLTFFDLPVMPLYLLVVFLIHPDLGYIVAGAGAILMTIALINQKFTAVPFGRANAYATRANLQADAMSRNAQVINAMGMIPEGVQLWGRETLESLKAQVQAQDYNVMLAGISKFSRLTTQIAILGWGAYLALHSEITGGMLIAASIIGSRALAPIEGAIEGWRGFIQARSSYARIRTLLVNSPLNLERLRLPRPRGKVTVERVLYVPPPSKKVILNGISFELEPGESMAIVGSSGAGKSTLARMLVGSIVPTAGNIRLDHMDLRNWDPRQFGESVGYLPQDVQLFPATIKANIARMREDASDDAIFDAAETADVHEMISQFSAGYETMIGLDGSPLSGGQKQRIGLARAFFGDPRMVVLDEPNSNLDSPGELALARALKRAKAKEITVIAITQRPTLLKSVDKIMLLKGGTVQAMGKRNEMLELLRKALPDTKGNSTKSLPRK